MMRFIGYTISILFHLLTAVSVAETTPNPAKAKLRNERRVKDVDTHLFSNIELRPQLSTSDGSFSSENLMEVGFAFSKNTKLSYQQELNTVSSETAGHSAELGDGSLRLFLGSLWEKPELNTTFSDQLRIYFPTPSAKRDAGMVVAIRNYFIWSVKVSEVVSLEFAEVPILHIYNEAGTKVKKDFVANPIFENRIVFTPRFQMMKDLALTLPLHFYTTKYRNFHPRAENNDGWVPYLSFSPEIDYQFTPISYVGIAYRTSNILTTTVSGTGPADGLGLGVMQFVLGFSF